MDPVSKYFHLTGSYGREKNPHPALFEEGKGGSPRWCDQSFLAWVGYLYNKRS